MQNILNTKSVLLYKGVHLHTSGNFKCVFKVESDITKKNTTHFYKIYKHNSEKKCNSEILFGIKNLELIINNAGLIN